MRAYRYFQDDGFVFPSFGPGQSRDACFAHNIGLRCCGRHPRLPPSVPVFNLFKLVF